MKAIIVAAGKGSRLLPVTENIPKCLVTVNNIPIIDYQFACLRGNGISEVIIVTGHFEEKIRNYVTEKFSKDFKVEFIFNKDYSSTQNAYSFFMGQDSLKYSKDGFVIFNSDLIFPAALLKYLIDSDYSDGMIVDEYTNIESDMVKVRVEDSRIIEMSKTLNPSLASYEAVGPVKFSQAGGVAFFKFLDKLFTSEGNKNWLFYTLGDFGKEYPFHAIKNPGLSWSEVDTLDDLHIAEEKCLELSNNFKTI